MSETMSDNAYIRLVRENKTYRQFWIAAFISMFGEWFNTIALFLLILKYTDSELLLGILMAVGALESLGILFNFAGDLTEIFPNTDVLMILFGFLSAIIDNVPLVAASMGMFPNLLDDPLWHALAFSAGTGGSMLIIGSAAGVVAMGMEKIDFFWYLKKVAIFAFIGFLSGYGTFMLLRDFVL